MKYKDFDFDFPKFIPNDLEGFMFFYPRKFPSIINFYTENVQKYLRNSEGFIKFCQQSYLELKAGFDKIKSDYDKQKNKNLDFLLEIDCRLHKLYAFRFWTINYLFADGPMHELYVDVLKELSPSLYDQDEDVENYERNVLLAQRNLLQSDYADLYLQNALNGVEFIGLLQSNTKTSLLLGEIIQMLEDKKIENKEIYQKLDPFIDQINKGGDVLHKKLYTLLEIPILQANFRHTREPIYHMIIHSIEFKNENIKLQDRYKGMKVIIDDLLNLAKQRFSNQDYLNFKNSYYMARNLSISKDILGNIDPVLLPFWLNLLQKEIPSKLENCPKFLPIGAGGIFYELVWRLPDEYKARIFSVDPTPFSLADL